MHNPHAGGVKIPPAVQELVKSRIEAHAQRQCARRYSRLDIRFRGPCCYIDAYRKPDAKLAARQAQALGEPLKEYVERMSQTPIHLCRIRYFGKVDSWTMAFYTYSNGKYSPCYFPNGTFHGTPEEAFDVGAMYLLD